MISQAKASAVLRIQEIQTTGLTVLVETLTIPQFPIKLKAEA